MFGLLLEGVGAMWRQGVEHLREWRENRRREQQRREVILKHARKTGVAPEEVKAERPLPPKPVRDRKPAPPEPVEAPAPVREARTRVVTPPLPLEEIPSRAPIERKLGGFTAPPSVIVDWMTLRAVASSSPAGPVRATGGRCGGSSRASRSPMRPA